MMTVKISLYFWQILSGKLSVKNIEVSSFEIIWWSLKTTSFIEPIKVATELINDNTLSNMH